MAKHLNVNLAFTADTSKAKAQIQELQNQLSKVVNTPTAGLGDKMAAEINQVTHAAAELQVHLQNATNIKTGNLDFTKLNQSIKNSGKSLADYATKIQSIGPEGQKAFMLLAQSVASAEVPIRRSNAVLSELWTTMKNTARWQLTSSMLHGFMGAVQSAVGYAEDLNESLNNIRIVTGNSVEQMADFAKEANKAAKSLSTSTTNYTNAALIYYQQGLDEQQVLERADITVKMANVSRQSAEEVSDQMTAIWNNFYDGSQSLEHYADAMTRLGADTASSSDEIAQGLEKFAAIGDMIGLSFDNAAAALATVTATTRQSADVVGTAFKTIFARIQGLSLGETLEDGTTLNKYSEALQKVGISIFEQNGELKDMDAILDDMGEKWKTMSKDQQTALAQTVAGVRQYNQLVALMENYDFYQENLISAQMSDGTLERQADIYAESWEAAKKRVKAASQGLYDSLINDEAFINILNTIEKIISGFENLIDSVGGFQGVVSGLGVIFTTVFNKQISQSLTNASYSLMSWTEKGRQKIQQQKLDQFSLMLEGAEIGETERKVLEAQFQSYQKLTESAKDLTDLEKQTYQILLDQQKARGALAIQKSEAAKIAQATADDARIDAKWAIKDAYNSKKVKLPGVEKPVNNETAVKTYENAVDKMLTTRDKYIQAKADNSKNVEKLANKYYAAREEVVKLEKALNKAKDGLISYKKTLEELHAANKQAKASLDEVTGKTEENDQTTQENTNDKNNNASASNNMAKGSEQVVKGMEKEKHAIVQTNEVLDEHNQKKDKLTSEQLANNFVASANAAMSAVSAIRAFSSAFESLKSDADPAEKASAALMSMTMGITYAGNALKGLDSIMVNTNQTLGEAAANTKIMKTVLGKLGVEADEATGLISGTGAALGSLAAYAAAAAVAIATVVAVIKFISNFYNKDAIAAKQATEAAENLANKYKETKSSLDELLSSIDNYDAAIETLKQCKENTEEWHDALEQVQNQIWDILEQYPELAKMDNLFDDDGNLNRGVVDNYIAEQKSKANNARASALSASARAAKANVVADETKLQRELDVIINAQMPVGSLSSDAGIQSDTSSTQFFSELYAQAQNKDFNVEEFNSVVDEYINGFTSTTDSFEEDIRDVAAQIRDLGKASQQADQQMENVGKLLANQILGNNATKYQKEKFATNYTSAEQSLYDEWLKKTTSGINQLSEKNDDDVAELWKKYSEATGTNYQLSSNAVQGDDNNRSFEYINEKGFKVVISAEELAMAIASSEAQIQTQQQSRDDLFNMSQGLLDENIINEAVDLSLLNDLVHTLDLTDEATKQSFQALMEGCQTAAEQTVEIEKLLSQMSGKERELADINTLVDNAVEKYGLNADDIEDQAKRIQDAYNLTAVEATKLAIENQRMNKGVEVLSENWNDWQKTLKKSRLNKEEKLTLDYTNTIQDLTKAVADLTGASEDLELPDEFFESEENLNLLSKAAKGSEQAINELGVAVGSTLVEAMKISNDVLRPDDDAFNIEKLQQFNTYKDTVLQGIQELQDKILAGEDLVGQSLDQILENSSVSAGSWVESLNAMAESTFMTVEEMNSLLNTLGLEADVTVKDVPQDVQVPVYKVQMEDVEKDPVTGMITSYTTRSIPIRTETHSGSVQVAQIGVNGADPGEPDIKYSGNGKVSTSSVKSSKSGGSGSKSKSPKKVNKNDIVERYKEINDQLDNVKDKMSDLSKESDRLYGANKLTAIDEQIALLEKEQLLLKEKRKQIVKNLELDKEALKLAAKKAGVEFIFDVNEIANYTEEMEKLYNQLNQLIEVAGDSVDEAEQKAIDDLQVKIDELKTAIKLFEDTRELLEDTDNDIQDSIYEEQDKFYEKLELRLELKLDINDSELKKIEYFLDKYSDNFYKMAESALFMQDKVGPIKQNLSNYQDHKADLDAAYGAGKISQADYIAGLKDVREGYYENLEALNELDKAMMHYYGDTLDAAAEEVASFTDHMEHLTNVFDHYINLAEILGKNKDYDMMGNFLTGKADTIRDRLNVAKEYYEMLKENSKADEYWANYQAALAAEDEDMAQWWKEQWDAEVDALDTAQSEMLDLTEQWAQAMKEVVGNNMAQISDELEKSLTNGLGFDKLMDDFDKLNLRQEEYLTKTNQIYETNKLMRTANKALDETSNKVAKQKLKNFVDETKSLQENTQLSQYELEIQQAKYDLLLAEIALEEAQNAKSTVRLSRDSEGNFGYIYTADQDAVNDAEQQRDDAENKLYNISLDGQQKYTEKYLQAQQQMFEELNELWRLYNDEHAISETEYNERYADIYNHYYGEDGILSTYSKLYNIGVQTDANATADNWLSSYGEMTESTETWSANVQDYYQKVQEQIGIWETVSVQANEDVEDALSNSEEATKKLTDESGKLADTLISDIIPAIEDEIKEVQAQTDAYADQRQELLKLIADYENYLNLLNTQIAVASVGFDKDVDYSSLINEYLNKGGKVGDATYNELNSQRDAKIEWLKTQGKGKDYWKFSGTDTTDAYNLMMAGGGDQEWFTSDYIDDDQLAGIFEALGVPLGALEEWLELIKTATDTINEKIVENNEKAIEIGDKQLSKADEVTEKTNTKIDNTQIKINEKLDSTNKETLTKLDDTNENTLEKLDTTSENTQETLENVGNDLSENLEIIDSTLNDINGTISAESGEIQSSISAAAREVSSSVGGAFSNLRSEVSNLKSQVSGVFNNVKQYLGFDTGGYTGEWGPSGKLAILHEKELVLNKNDTANLLTSISFLHDIINMIDAQASMASMFNMPAVSNVMTTNETLEQTVTIHAEFPNATNHNEIEEAFNNLVNRASQYANRK